WRSRVRVPITEGRRGGCFLDGKGVYVHSPLRRSDMPLSKRGALSAFGALALILVSAASPDAAPPTRDERRGRPNLDARSGPAVTERRDQLAANPSAAVKALGASLGPQGIASIDGLTGTPRIVARLDGFLTGASGRPAARIALDYVRADAARRRRPGGAAGLEEGQRRAENHGVLHRRDGRADRVRDPQGQPPRVGHVRRAERPADVPPGDRRADGRGALSAVARQLCKR